LTDALASGHLSLQGASRRQTRPRLKREWGRVDRSRHLILNRPRDCKRQRLSIVPLGETLGRRKAADPRVRRPALQGETFMPSGVTAKETKMTMTQTTTGAVAKSSVLMQAVFVALIGIVLVATAGLAQSDALHDAAHDVRHSTGFPCH
jgi:cobalt transporter subunit CbtB